MNYSSNVNAVWMVLLEEFNRARFGEIEMSLRELQVLAGVRNLSTVQSAQDILVRDELIESKGVGRKPHNTTRWRLKWAVTESVAAKGISVPETKRKDRERERRGRARWNG